MGINQCKARSRPYKRCQLHNARNRYSHLLAWLITCQSSQLGYLSSQSQSESYVKRKYPFNWGLEHNSAFQLKKKEIAAAPIFAYYNPKKPTVLQTNASCKGLGACLLQNQKPVYFASRALSVMQKGYVAIELKSLAVTWAMESSITFCTVMNLH